MIALWFRRDEIEKASTPTAATRAARIQSIGHDSPVAILSDMTQLLYEYLRQQFAQVTNPPIDPIREELVMSLSESIGAV